MKKYKYLMIYLFTFIVVFLTTTNIFTTDTLALEINSPSVILIERKTGNILYEKNAKDIRYPASTTKIMTAILTLENCKLNDVVRVSYSATQNVPSGYSIADLRVDEELTIEQLLHLLLIPSASDAANTLAEHIGGSIESFATMMNTKAKEIGCINTNFVNPNGMHNASHTSTAYDLALMANYAMNNETFRSIVSKASYILYPTNKCTTERYFKTTNSLLNKYSDDYYYDKAIGIKTGFTTPAGNCLVAAGKVDDMECITVILGATQNSDGLSERFLEAKKLLEFAFGNYTYKTIKYKTDIVKTIDVKGATKDTKNLNLELDKNIYAFINKEDLNTKFQPTITLNENIKAPILKNEVLGTATYTIENQTYTVNLVASNDVYKSNILFIIGIIIVFIFLICLKIFLDKKKHNLNKKNYRLKKSKK